MREVESPLRSGPRLIFVDALNLAYWCGNPPSLRIPIALMTGLMKSRHSAILCFDASARYQLENEFAVYEQLRQHSRWCIEVPSGIPADRVMLRKATTAGGRIVSRDRFRDHRKRYRKLIDDPARLISGEIGNDQLRIPLLSVELSLPRSAELAWCELVSLLSSQTDRRAVTGTASAASA